MIHKDIYIFFIYVFGVFVVLTLTHMFSFVGGDEGRYIQDAILVRRGNVPIADFTTRTPILLWLMVLSQKVVGLSLFAFRLPVLVATALTAGFLYLLGRDLVSRNVGLTAAFLFAVMPFTLWNSLMIKSETLVVLFTVIAAWFLLKALHNDATRWFFLSGVFLGLAFIERQSVVGFMIAAAAIVSMYGFSTQPDKKNLERLRYIIIRGFIMIGGVIIGFLPVFLYLATQNFQSVFHFWFGSFLYDTFSNKLVTEYSVYQFFRGWALLFVETIAVQASILFIALMIFLISIASYVKKYRSVVVISGGVAFLFAGAFVFHSLHIIALGYFRPAVFLGALLFSLFAIHFFWRYSKQFSLPIFASVFLLSWMAGYLIVYSAFGVGYPREFIPPLVIVAAIMFSAVPWSQLSRQAVFYAVIIFLGLWGTGMAWFYDPPTGGWWWRQDTIYEAAEYLNDHTSPGERVFSASSLPVLFAQRHTVADINSYGIKLAGGENQRWGTNPTPREFYEILVYEQPRYIVMDLRMERHFFDQYKMFREYIYTYYEKEIEFGTRQREDWIELWKRKPDARIQWTFEAGGPLETSVRRNNGILFFGSEDHFLYAVEERTGTELWRFETGGPIIRSSAAIAPDGTVYVGSDDGNVYAVTQKGDLKWKFQTNGFVRSSPTVDKDGTIYVGSFDGMIYAIGPDGDNQWSYQTNGAILSSPLVISDTMYVGSQNNFLYAFQKDGTLKWYVQLDGVVLSSPRVMGDQMVYVGTERGTLYAIDKTGTIHWTFVADGSENAVTKGFESSPAVGIDGTVYIGSKDHNLYAVNSNGTKQWSYETGWEIESSPVIGPDGTIYVGSEDYKLHAVHPDGMRKWVVNTDGQVDSSATVVSDSILYIGSADGRMYTVYSN